MMEQHFETPYDVIMKTVKDDCHVTCILIVMAQKLETRCEKKETFILFKIQSKHLYFTRNSLLEKPLSSKSLPGGLDSPYPENVS